GVVGDGADDWADDRRHLVDPIRPVRHQVAGVVVDPGFAVDLSGALEARVHGIAVGARALELERPARPADRADELLHRSDPDDEGAAPELEVVEIGVDRGNVEQAVVGPGTDEGIVTHLVLLSCEHDLFRKPLATFRDHASGSQAWMNVPTLSPASARVRLPGTGPFTMRMPRTSVVRATSIRRPASMMPVQHLGLRGRIGGLETDRRHH